MWFEVFVYQLLESSFAPVIPDSSSGTLVIGEALFLQWEDNQSCYWLLSWWKYLDFNQLVSCLKATCLTENKASVPLARRGEEVLTCVIILGGWLNLAFLGSSWKFNSDDWFFFSYTVEQSCVLPMLMFPGADFPFILTKHRIPGPTLYFKCLLATRAKWRMHSFCVLRIRLRRAERLSKEQIAL